MTSNAINLRTGSVVRVHSNFGRALCRRGGVWSGTEESRQAAVALWPAQGLEGSVCGVRGSDCGSDATLTKKGPP